MTHDAKWPWLYLVVLAGALVQTLPPPARGENLGIQISSLLKMLGDPANEGLPTDREQSKEDAKQAAGKKDAGPVRLTSESKAPVVAKAGFVSGLAMIVLVPLVYIVLGLVWLLHFIPSIGPLDKVVGWIRKLDPTISYSLGDISTYVDHEIWSANARARVEDVVIHMLKAPDVDDITIIAHSMGAVVAYDALTEGGNIAEAVSELPEQGQKKKITFITIGGAINRVFEMLPSVDSPRARNRKKGEIKFNDQQITRPLARAITGFGLPHWAGHLEDKFYWLDIFSRRDPVPAGPLSDHILDKVGIDPVKQLKERRVINKDSMFFDHVAYWENRELVMPRIVRAINGGTDYPWPEAGITREKVARRIKIAARYASLSEIILFLVVLGAVVFGLLKLAGVV